MERSENRNPRDLRSFEFLRSPLSAAPGSILVRSGKTQVLCTASIELGVPPWRTGKGSGWITAEYSMLPGSTRPRKGRERAKIDGRTTEIQRLIGRSIRAITDLDKLGERTLTVDCDVLYADGGTRTASITGALIAVADALRSVPELAASGEFPLNDFVAAISVGIVDGVPLLDLAYEEDVHAEVDMNVVMTGSGEFVEIQGTGEEATFSESQLQQLLGLAKHGIAQLIARQKEVLGETWPFLPRRGG
jgi:ribonuclease PH